MESDPARCRATVLSFIAAEHPDLRDAGLWALGFLIEPDDVVLLQEALADPDPRIRRSALGSLTGLKTDGRAYTLVVSALQDPDAWTRGSAVLHLRWFAEPAAVEQLIPLIYDPAETVRSALGETLGTLPVGADRRPPVTDALLALLADPVPLVRAAAARGLGQLGGPLDALQSRAADPDPQVRTAIAAALAREAVPHLAGTLQGLAIDESAAVRAALTTALGVSTWPGARPLLAALAQDPDRAVRVRADVALARNSDAATG
jgi:HEAT repeat protein